MACSDRSSFLPGSVLTAAPSRAFGQASGDSPAQRSAPWPPGINVRWVSPRRRTSRAIVTTCPAPGVRLTLPRLSPCSAGPTMPNNGLLHLLGSREQVLAHLRDREVACGGRLRHGGQGSALCGSLRGATVEESDIIVAEILQRGTPGGSTACLDPSLRRCAARDQLRPDPTMPFGIFKKPSAC